MSKVRLRQIHLPSSSPLKSYFVPNKFTISPYREMKKVLTKAEGSGNRAFKKFVSANSPQRRGFFLYVSSAGLHNISCRDIYTNTVPTVENDL